MVETNFILTVVQGTSGHTDVVNKHTTQLAIIALGGRQDRYPTPIIFVPNVVITTLAGLTGHANPWYGDWLLH